MSDITVSADSNFDDSGNLALANGDNITINTNATLTINSDVRWGQNAAVVGNVTLSSSTGGKLKIDGTTVWWIPYDGGTSTVPAIGSTVTGAGSGATGELIGLFTALGVAPTAAGGATPSTGFIKLRSKSGTFNDNENLQVSSTTFAVVNSATGGQRGWIHFVGEENTTLTCPRLGTFEITGDWFELGVSSGAASQTFQFPVADYCPGIWVETGSGTGIYKRWACVVNHGANDIAGTDDESGWFFWCSSAGVITLGDGSTGRIPPSGAKIRIPNVIMSSSSSSDWTANTCPSTMTARWDLTFSTCGAIAVDKACCNTYFSTTGAYSCEISDSAFANSLLVAEIATPADLSNIIIGSVQSIDVAGFSSTMQLGGMSVAGLTVAKTSYATPAVNISATADLEMSEVFAANVDGAATTATRYTIQIANSSDIDLSDLASMNGPTRLTGCARASVDGYRYGDRPGSERSTGGFAAVIVNASSVVVVSGITNLGSLPMPYSSYMFVSDNSFDVKLREIGTQSSPLDFSEQVAAISAISSGNNKEVKYQRVYVENPRTNMIGSSNNEQGWLLEHVYCETDALPGLTACDCIVRGCRCTSVGTGAVSGVFGYHFTDVFTSDTEGLLQIRFNEPSQNEPSASAFSITAGAPRFDGNGSLTFASGDEVVWEWPFFVLGHTALQNAAYALTGGTSVDSYTSVQYQIDTGSGWNGTWKDCTGANLSGETISASTGFKMKFKFAFSGTSTILTFRILTTTTLSAQTSNLYPLDSTSVNVVLENIVSGSRYRIENADTGALLFEGTASGTTVTRVYTHTGTDVDVKIVVRSSNGTDRYYPFETYGTITEDGLNVWIAQVEDLIAA